jgi:hypothetical protein
MMPQVPPKDGGVLNPFAADPLGRQAQQQAHMPPYQGTSGVPDGDLPGDPETDACDCEM